MGRVIIRWGSVCDGYLNEGCNNHGRQEQGCGGAAQTLENIIFEKHIGSDEVEVGERAWTT